MGRTERSSRATVSPPTPESKTPIGSVADFSPELLAKLDQILGEEVTTLVHCASGNRVGAAFALHAQAFGGASVEEAMTLGERHGLTSMSSAIRQRLESVR